MVYDHSISRAAGYLGITVQAVHKRIAAGTLQARKANGRWMVDGGSLLSAKETAVRPGRPRKGDAYTLMNGTHAVMDFSYDELRREFIPREVHDLARANRQRHQDGAGLGRRPEALVGASQHTGRARRLGRQSRPSPSST